MNRTAPLAVLAAALLLAPGCGEPPRAAAPAPEKPAAAKPAWYTKAPNAPGKLYAVGGANKYGIDKKHTLREAAEIKARRELAAQIEIAIQAEQKLKETASTQASSVNGVESRMERCSAEWKEEVTTRVKNQGMSSTKVLETWEGDGEVAVLMECDLVAWAQSLRARLGDIDQKIAAQAKAYEGETAKPGPAAKLFLELGPLLTERDLMAKRLRMADPQGQQPACPVDIPALRRGIAKALEATTLSLPAATPDTALLLPRLGDAFAKGGFAVKEGAGGTLALAIELKLTSLQPGNNMTRVNGTLVAQITNPATGKVIGDLKAENSGMHLNADEAKVKCLSNLATDLAQQLDGKLLSLVAQGM